MGRSLTLMALAIAASLLLVASGQSKVIVNTIAAGAMLEGAHVLATGIVACDAGERLRLELTVTQRTTGAIARGTTRGVCTGEVQEWPVRLERRGRARFVAGAVNGCALAVTSLRGKPTDAEQWCRADAITLTGG